MELFLVGLILGFLASGIGICRLIVGKLRVDHSDPTEKPYLFLELTKDVESFSKRKFVVLEVRLEDFIKVHQEDFTPHE